MRPIIAEPAVTRHIIKRFGIKASRKLGQNFLISPEVVGMIVKIADINEGDEVLEIGPGIGTLTQSLLATGAKITTVELDKRLIPILARTLEGYDNFTVIEADFMQLDIKKLMPKDGYKAVANLPYYITTPILMKLIEVDKRYEDLIVMVQEEVAERMVAKPGGKDYGALSIAVQYHCEVEISLRIPPTAFYPAPAVNSAVVHCRRRTDPRVSVLDEKMFFRCVKAAFSQRRKILSNALRSGFEPDIILGALRKSGIEGGRRGETLSLDEFAILADCILLELKQG